MSVEQVRARGRVVRSPISSICNLLHTLRRHTFAKLVLDARDKAEVGFDFDLKKNKLISWLSSNGKAARLFIAIV